MTRSAALHEFDPDSIVLATGTANPELAISIGKNLDVPVDRAVTRFKDGEPFVRFKDNLRGRHVFIINPSSPIINPDGTAVDGAIEKHFFETCLMADAATRGSADEITVVMPYYGGARQDRKVSPRTPITASLLAYILKTAGADRIVTIDLHAGQTTGSVLLPWDDLPPYYVFVPVIKGEGLIDPVILAPDEGSGKKTAQFAQTLGARHRAMAWKIRDPDDNDMITSHGINGSVEGYDVLIPDDIASTLSTFSSAANEARRSGAKRIIGAVTHGIFNGQALEILEASDVERLYVTDSIRHRDAVIGSPKISIVPLGPMLAIAIKDIETGKSLSDDIILARNR